MSTATASIATPCEKICAVPADEITDFLGVDYSNLRQLNDRLQHLRLGRVDFRATACGGEVRLLAESPSSLRVLEQCFNANRRKRLLLPQRLDRCECEDAGPQRLVAAMQAIPDYTAEDAQRRLDALCEMLLALVQRNHAKCFVAVSRRWPADCVECYGRCDRRHGTLLHVARRQNSVEIVRHMTESLPPAIGDDGAYDVAEPFEHDDVAQPFEHDDVARPFEHDAGTGVGGNEQSPRPETDEQRRQQECRRRCIETHNKRRRTLASGAEDVVADNIAYGSQRPPEPAEPPRRKPPRRKPHSKWPKAPQHGIELPDSPHETQAQNAFSATQKRRFDDGLMIDLDATKLCIVDHLTGLQQKSVLNDDVWRAACYRNESLRNTREQLAFVQRHKQVTKATSQQKIMMQHILTGGMRVQEST
jgi:hypothetical protein